MGADDQPDDLALFRVFLVAGRHLPTIGGEFRHPWCLPENWDPAGPTTLNDGFAVLERLDALHASESGIARIRPLRPELWAHIRPTDQLGLFAGVTPSGTALVLERVGSKDAEGYLADRMVSVGPLELRVLQAGLNHKILDARLLPKLATRYLVLGVPSTSLAELAGLDVGQEVNPHDAQDLLEDVLVELGQPSTNDNTVTLAAMLLAKLGNNAFVAPQQTSQRFYRLAVEIDYEWPVPQIGELYGLDDEWEGGWGRTPSQLSDATAALCTELLAESEPVHGVLDMAALRRLSEIVVA